MKMSNTISKNDKELLSNLFKQDKETGLFVYADGKVTNGEQEIKYHYNRGYKSITYNGKNYAIHRLVALNWCVNPDPDNFNIVNHIDGDKTNNCANNLEWCDHAHNNEHAIANNLRTDAVGVKVKNLYNGHIRIFPSITRCAKHFGVHTDIIAKKLNGKAKPTFKVYVIAKENEEFPNYTLAQVRDMNTGFKTPLAYKKIHDKEWIIEPHGTDRVAKLINASSNSVLRVLNGTHESFNGYLIRKLTNKEYANCDLARIETVSKRSFNNVPTPIIVTDKRSGEVREYPSTKAFADELGVNPKTVQRVRLNSSDKETYKHYLIKYKV